MSQAYCIKEPTQEDLAEWFYYEKGNLYWRKNTTRTKTGQLVGSVGADGYRRVRFKKRKVYVHRLIWIYHKNTHPMLIDHVDRNKLNNAIENLRPASKSLNALNSKVPSSNKTTYTKGVELSGSKYRARIWFNGKRHSLGSYNELSQARAAYEAALAAHFAELHNPNT